MSHCDDIQAINVAEVVRVARIQGKLVRHRRRSNHCVVAARRSLAPRSAERGGDLAKGSRCCRVEWKRIEVGFGLLEVRLACRSLGIALRHERTHGQLGQRHGAYERLGWERRGVAHVRQENHRRGIEKATSRRPAGHKRESKTASISSRSATGST